MVEDPTITQATTADGVRIASHAIGAGPPVVMLFPYHVNHLRLNWRVGVHRRAIEALARHFTVVTLDLRGSGDSQRGVAGLSLDAFATDIDAVLEPFARAPVALCAMGPAAGTACHYASTRAERVAGLVFINGGESEANRHLLELRRLNAPLEAKVRGALIGGDDDWESAENLAAVAREALDDDALAQWEHLFAKMPLLDLAGAVAAPCLCVHATGDELVSEAACRTFAERLPRSELITVPVSAAMQVWRDRAALRAIAAFLAERLGLDPGAVRRGGQRGLGDRHPAGLSEREVEVLGLVAAGGSNRQIAEALGISLNTVSHHVRNIFTKIGASNRTEAAAFAHRWAIPARDGAGSKPPE